MKIETPTVCKPEQHPLHKLLTSFPTQASGHAFILRRFDTGAISLTTMFRAAFPNALDEEEKREVAWVKERYDLSGNNGSSKELNITRLAGTWVSPKVAMELGTSYSLGNLIAAVVQAQPDPNGNYRRSGKAAAAGNTPKAVSIPSAPTSASKTLPTPSPTAATPNPAKRRKESSPAPAPAPAPTPTPAKVALPRRSARTKSPPPKSAATMTPLMSIVKAPKGSKTARREQVVTPGGSDETVVDEDGEAVDDVAGSELRQQDIAEQKEMIKDLKAQRDAVMRGSAAPEDTEVDGAAKLKRARDEAEEGLVFDFKEPEVGERAIATNRRVSRFHLEPRQKSFAWGVAVFAFGMGAV